MFVRRNEMIILKSLINTDNEFDYLKHPEVMFMHSDGLWINMLEQHHKHGLTFASNKSIVDIARQRIIVCALNNNTFSKETKPSIELNNVQENVVYFKNATWAEAGLEIDYNNFYCDYSTFIKFTHLHVYKDIDLKELMQAQGLQFAVEEFLNE